VCSGELANKKTQRLLMFLVLKRCASVMFGFIQTSHVVSILPFAAFSSLKINYDLISIN